MNIPNELINLILSYRGKHPITNVICCWLCKERDEDCVICDYLYIYHRPESVIKFEIVCSDCNYELGKD